MERFPHKHGWEEWVQEAMLRIKRENPKLIHWLHTVTVKECRFFLLTPCCWWQVVGLLLPPPNVPTKMSVIHIPAQTKNTSSLTNIYLTSIWLWKLAKMSSYTLKAFFYRQCLPDSKAERLCVLLRLYQVQVALGDVWWLRFRLDEVQRGLGRGCVACSGSMHTVD